MLNMRIKKKMAKRKNKNKKKMFTFIGGGLAKF